MNTTPYTKIAKELNRLAKAYAKLAKIINYPRKTSHSISPGKPSTPSYTPSSKANTPLTTRIPYSYVLSIRIPGTYIHMSQ